MPGKEIFLGLLFVVHTILCITCSVRSVEESPQQHSTPLTESQSEWRAASLSLSVQDKERQIRKIDFKNFTYPYGSLSDVRFFTLKNGSKPEKRDDKGMIEERAADFSEVYYGDLTGNSVEEAVVRISFVSGGSWLPNNVYVYSLQKGRPHLLWLIETGDRADRGLKQVLIDNGELILELYSTEGNQGICCPTRFTRTRYIWDLKAKKFRINGKPELLLLNKN